MKHIALRRCFSRHTAELLRPCDPDVIIFSGERTHLFSDQVHQTLPDATPVMTLHYAHRLGADREALALEEVRHVLDTWRPKSR